MCVCEREREREREEREEGRRKRRKEKKEEERRRRKKEKTKKKKKKKTNKTNWKKRRKNEQQEIKKTNSDNNLLFEGRLRRVRALRSNTSSNTPLFHIHTHTLARVRTLVVQTYIHTHTHKHQLHTSHTQAPHTNLSDPEAQGTCACQSLQCWSCDRARLSRAPDPHTFASPCPTRPCVHLRDLAQRNQHEIRKTSS